jgi:hypothetical protein
LENLLGFSGGEDYHKREVRDERRDKEIGEQELENG